MIPGDAPEWWQQTTSDAIDDERKRCATILAVCLRADRPWLAARWIANGAAVESVMDVLILMLANERAGNFRTRGSVTDEFDESPEVFAGLDISRAEYTVARAHEKWRAKKRCDG